MTAAQGFEDNFSTDTMADWEVVDIGQHAAPSKWFIAGGELHQTSNIYTTSFDGDSEKDWTGTFLVSRRATFRNGMIDTRFRSTDDDGIGLVWRYRDRRNYYKVQLDGSARFWQISKTVDGKFTCLAVGRSKVYTKGRTHRLQVHIEGPIMAVVLDGKLLGAAEDDSLTEGRVGFESRGNAGSHFDYLRIVTPGPALNRGEIDQWLLHYAAAGIQLEHWACLPGEALTLRFPARGRSVLPRMRVQVRAPSGATVAETPIDPSHATQTIWKNTHAPVGVYRAVVLSDGTVLHEWPFNVWNRIPRPIGVSVHRGDTRCAPENTLPAFRFAVEKGAHQIEFDIRLTKDDHLVIMHDATVDRTTNGTGRVADATLEELRKLDAGSWKGPEWKGVRIPTFHEVLETVPPYIQLNCHLRPGVAVKVTREIVTMKRLAQCFLACGKADALAAKKVDPRIRICNMQHQGGADTSYPDETIAMGAEYIQILGWTDRMPEVCAKLRAHQVTINYCCTSDPALFRRLIEAGIQYPLTNNLDAMIPVLRNLGVPMAQPLRQPHVQSTGTTP